MATIKIDDRDFQRAARALTAKEYRTLAGQTVGRTLLKSANVVRRSVRAAAKPHRRTGKMASRVQYRRTGTGLDTEIRVKAGGPVAHLVAEGARAHEITAHGKGMTIRGRSAGNSANTGSGGKAIRAAGADVFAVRRAVHHPGYRPRSNFWEDGVHAAEPEIQQLIDAGATEMVHGLAMKIRGR